MLVVISPSKCNFYHNGYQYKLNINCYQIHRSIDNVCQSSLILFFIRLLFLRRLVIKLPFMRLYMFFLQGYPTGTYENDNARALTENRFAVAAIGDESQSCSAGQSSSSNSLGSTSSTTTSTCKDMYSNCQAIVQYTFYF